MNVKINLLAFILLFAINGHGQDFEGLKKINGAFLYFKIFGKGEPLIIIHGGPGMNSSYFTPHLNQLSKKYRIVLYDQRACGKSQIPSPDSISLKFFADDLEAIRKVLDLEKINILAHSWGAIIAVNYGIYYPDKLNKMILLNPVPLSKDFDQEMYRNQQKKATAADTTHRAIILGSRGFRSGDSDAYRKLLLISFRHSFYDDRNYGKFNLEIQASYAKASGALMQGLGKELGQYNFYDALKKFTFPVQIQHGEFDAIPLQASELARSSLPKGSLILFNKSGHFVFIDQPSKFNSSAISFLAKE